MSSTVHAAFDFGGITLSLTSILPIRQVKPADLAWGKYASILASIREIGVIEPLIVHPQPEGVKQGAYLLLDGHMRLKALQELGRDTAFCLVASTDDAFTYNDKVNRLSLIQEHAMIMRAMQHGVTAEQIAKALAVDVAKIKSHVNLLDGVHQDAVELLKTKPITAATLRLFKKVRPLRQVDMAQLMVSADNYTRSYAEALIVGTPKDQLLDSVKTKIARGVSDEDVAKMEKEMELLERDYRLHEDHYGEDSLHLNAAQRYVKRLLDNAKVKRFLTNRYPEILEEFQDIAAIEAL